MSDNFLPGSNGPSNLWVCDGIAHDEGPLRFSSALNVSESASIPAATRANASEAASLGNKKEPKQASKSRRKWKRPKDKPKRPLSAYNLFFQHEREKIIASTATPVMALSSPETQAKKRRRRHRKTHGKISFADLAKTIGGKWKELDAASKAVFESRARAEKLRYKKEVESWNKAREAKNNVDESKLDQKTTNNRQYFVGGLPKSRADAFNKSSTFPLKSKSVPQQLDHEAFPKMFSKQESRSHSPLPMRESFTHSPQKAMSHSPVNLKQQHQSFDSLRSLSTLLFSGGPLIKDPKFNATAHQECLEITRQTIEMAKATLSMPMPNNLTSFIPMNNPTATACSNIGVANNDSGFHKFDSSALESSVMVPDRQVHQDVSTTDAIDSAFWDTEERQLICRRDFFNSPRNSLGSFWDVDLGPAADDLEPAK